MLACRLIACLALTLFATPAYAHDAKVGDLVVMEPWARATIGQVKNGAAYLTVINHGTAGDRLLAVSTPVAAEAQLHSHVMDEGVMKMRQVEAVEIAAKGSTALEPGGFHVMLMGVKEPLVEGDAFPMTLTFETAGSVEVEVHVQGIAAMQPGDGAGEGHGGHSQHGDHSDHGGHGEHDEAAGSHGHGAEQHHEVVDLAEGPSAPTLDFAIAEAQGGGWTLEILTTNFQFAPDHVDQPHRAGEGHAHLYVNGEKIGRIYDPQYHIDLLPSGRTAVTVTLNSNDHRGLAVGGQPLSVTKEVHVP